MPPVAAPLGREDGLRLHRAGRPRARRAHGGAGRRAARGAGRQELHGGGRRARGRAHHRGDAREGGRLGGQSPGDARARGDASDGRARDNPRAEGPARPRPLRRHALRLPPGGARLAAREGGVCGRAPLHHAALSAGGLGGPPGHLGARRGGLQRAHRHGPPLRAPRGVLWHGLGRGRVPLRDERRDPLRPRQAPRGQEGVGAHRALRRRRRRGRLTSPGQVRVPHLTAASASPVLDKCARAHPCCRRSRQVSQHVVSRRTRRRHGAVPTVFSGSEDGGLGP
mmetsp:Transcript_78582/g.202396  ORF Transcript_78582/g.202396 Transcript_78582/m.202396 type:complete len:282 (-) Transcript_78582:46-891(-)